MKTHRLIILVMVLLLQAVSLAQYAPRQDVMWARTVPAGTITMDGVLNEAAWAQAESIKHRLRTAGTFTNKRLESRTKSRCNYRSNYMQLLNFLFQVIINYG